MNVTLDPELQAYVDKLVAEGHYPNADAAINHALNLCRLEDEFVDANREWLTREVQVGLDQLNRGESSDWDARTIKRMGRALLAQRRHGTDESK